MADALFYILYSKDGNYKECSIQIPKKYHYENTYYNYTDFIATKVMEYNVLFDYVKSNKDSLKEKWGLSEEDYIEIKEGLREVLIKEYFKGEILKYWTLLGTFLLKKFVRRLVRRIRVWLAV